MSQPLALLRSRSMGALLRKPHLRFPSMHLTATERFGGSPHGDREEHAKWNLRNDRLHFGSLSTPIQDDDAGEGFHQNRKISAEDDGRGRSRSQGMPSFTNESRNNVALFTSHTRMAMGLGLSESLVAMQPKIGVLGQRRALFHSSPATSYSRTAKGERAAAIMLSLASVSACAFAASSALQSYNEWKASQPSHEEVEAEAKAKAEAASKEEGNQDAQKDTTKEQKASAGDSERSDKNIFKEWFGVGVGSKYYEGGFEDTMTRREAALILGVRESSPPNRIKAAHRKLLVLNHPDTGGSTYIAGKINEAKELLLKGPSSI